MGFIHPQILNGFYSPPNKGGKPGRCAHQCGGFHDQAGCSHCSGFCKDNFKANRSVSVLQDLLQEADTKKTELREGDGQRGEEEINERKLAGEEREGGREGGGRQVEGEGERYSTYFDFSPHFQVAGEEGGGRRRREASWGQGGKEKDATLQDIRWEFIRCIAGALETLHFMHKVKSLKVLLCKLYPRCRDSQSDM